jgi:thymidine kinase
MSKLYFRYAAMNAGKSTALLQAAHNYEERGMRVLLPADIACLLIDEAQFLRPHQVRQLHRLAHGSGVPVLCYGLRSDFRGEAFAGSAALMTLADALEEMKTICACARKASMNMRIGADGRRVTEGEQVEIGGNDRYRAVCPSCFYADDAADAAQAPGLFG